MADAKHTPGGWQIFETPDGCGYLEVHGNVDGDANDDGSLRMISTKVCEVMDNDDERANANLIVAGPDMLEALMGVAQLRASIKTWALSHRLPGWQNEDALFAACDAAIAKATGAE